MRYQRFLISSITIAFGILLLVCLAASASAAQQYYSISLKNSGNNTLFMGLEVLAGEGMAFESSGNGFRATVLSYNSTQLFAQDFTMAEGAEKTITLPYIREASTITVTNLGTGKSLNINVIAYADLCGDNVCEPKEDHLKCPADCSSGGNDSYCDGLDDGKCDADCASGIDADCIGSQAPITSPSSTTTTQPSTTTTYAGSIGAAPSFMGIFRPPYLVLILAVIGVVALLISIFFLSMRKQGDSRIDEYVRNNLSRGYDPARIRQHLLEHGYDKDQVDSAIYSAISR